MPRRVRSLASESSHARWGLRTAGGEGLASMEDRIGARRIEAQVPGCVHLDLIREGIIEHTDLGDAEVYQQWIGRTDWIYSCTFDAAERVGASERAELVLDGIDGTADVWLNGERIAECKSRWFPLRVDVGGRLRPAGNSLGVHFRAPVTEVERLARELGARPVNGDWTPYVFQRRAACNFGWDWGPKVATAGLREPPRIELWSGARIAAVRPTTLACSPERAQVRVEMDVEVAGSAAQKEVGATLRLELDDGRVIEGSDALVVARAGTITLVVAVVVDRPPLWWPRGEGAQRLHALSVSLRCGADEECDRWTRRIGLRQVELLTDGTFHFRVNGRDIFAKGANWIPEGLFQGPGTDGAVDERLEQACEANLNMLRVWGGGAYERDRFYERCDELGLLVWHDFMFACATYPEEADFPLLVEQEARQQVGRLMHHPCIALWCGGNENVWGWFSWGWRERLKPGQSWGWRYWSEILPRVCRDLDPSRPFWTDSPWSGSIDHFPNDRSIGDCHIWDAAMEEYRDGPAPLFVSEFGCQGYPAWETLVERLRPEQLALPSEELLRRQRGTGGDEPFIDRHIGERFQEPCASQRERVERSQRIQAYAVKTGIVWWRLSRPRCMGAIVWMLNDAWAGPSQSAVDVAGRRKAAFFALRDSCAPRRLWIAPVPDASGAATGVLAVRGVNDLQEPWRGHFELRRGGGGDGDGALVHRVPFEIPPASAATIATLEELLGAPLGDGEQVVCACDGFEDLWPDPLMRRRSAS